VQVRRASALPAVARALNVWRLSQTRVVQRTMTGGEQQTLGLSPLLLAQAAGARHPENLTSVCTLVDQGTALVKPRNVRHLVS
jgi:hypothetical protein